MSNFFNERYTIWLMQYNTRVQHPTVQAIAGELITSLPKIKYINDLISLLAKYINPHGDDTKLNNPTLYGPINFYAQLLSWQAELDIIETDYPKAQAVLLGIQVNPTITPLIRFLNELMNQPKMLLHQSMPNLLTALCAKNLSDLLNFMANLKKAPLPVSPMRGTSAALTLTNPDHAACIELFNNVSAQVDEKNELWIQANNLLDSALLMYQEMQLVEVNLEDDEKQNEDRPMDDFCVIL